MRSSEGSYHGLAYHGLAYHGLAYHGLAYRSLAYRGRIEPMKVDKISVSFDPDLGDAVRGAASRADRGLSGWLAEAAQAKLRSEALGDFLDDWEAEHGALSTDQLVTATTELRLDVARDLHAE